MVRAILAGQKTQTRRALKKQPCISLANPNFNGQGWGFYEDGRTGGPYQHIGKCPYGQPGDRLWVRENCWAHKDTGEIFAYCAVDETLYDDNKTVKKVPSIHMPRAASRIDLLIKNIRVERLQDISEEDAASEGCPIQLEKRIKYIDRDDTARGWFRSLWGSINGADSWDKNPWVWVIEFERKQK